MVFMVIISSVLLAVCTSLKPIYLQNAGRHFLRPRYIEWRVWKRRGVEPMERKPDIDDLIFGDERPISQR